MNRWRANALAGTLAVGLAVIATTDTLGAPQQAAGKPTLDQVNTATVSSTINGGASPYEWQQGVRAGIAGQLTRIDVFVVIDPSFDGVSTTEVSLTLGQPWQNSGPAWSTTAILKAGWNTFNVSKANVFVDVGDPYAIGIHGYDQDEFNPGIAISYGEQYPGGELFLNGSSAESVGNDLLFRTFVRPLKTVKGN